MKINLTKVMTIVSLTVPGTAGMDTEGGTYAHFVNEKDDSVALVNFAVENPGCFTVSNAHKVSFWSTLSDSANGPWCLHAFKNGDCTDFVDSVQFEGVEIDNESTYRVPDKLTEVGHFSFTETGCKDPLKVDGHYFY